MQNFPSETDKNTLPAKKFYSLQAIITLILLPPLCFLSVPAIIFSSTAKSLYSDGRYKLSAEFSNKAKRFIVSAWAIFFIILSAVFALGLISHLSLI